MQVIVFADGVDRVRSTIIFNGKGLRITTKEKESYYKHVRVIFQEKAWCDENFMKDWINSKWPNPFTNPMRSKNSLIADVHRAEQTDCLKALLTEKMTSLCNVIPGCTSREQLVDVTVNKLFKDEVRRLIEDHLDKHLQLYVEDKLSVSQQKNLMINWVGQVWRKISGMKESIIRSF